MHDIPLTMIKSLLVPYLLLGSAVAQRNPPPQRPSATQSLYGQCRRTNPNVIRWLGEALTKYWEKVVGRHGQGQPRVQLEHTAKMTGSMFLGHQFLSLQVRSVGGPSTITNARSLRKHLVLTMRSHRVWKQSARVVCAGHGDKNSDHGIRRADTASCLDAHHISDSEAVYYGYGLRRHYYSGP